MLNKPARVVFALALVLCVAGAGFAGQSRPAQARDDAAARAKSAENLKRIASNGVGFATETEEIRVPRTLRELQMSEFRVPLETFLNPRLGSRLPENIGDSREAQAEWVEKNSDYVWAGNGRKLSEMYADTIIAWEKPDDLKDGIHIALVTSEVRFVKFPEAHEMIRRGRVKEE